MKTQYDLHVDERFGHIAVTNEAGTRIADVVDLGDSCSIECRFLTAGEAFAVGSALQKWSINKRRNRAAS